MEISNIADDMSRISHEDDGKDEEYILRRN